MNKRLYTFILLFILIVGTVLRLYHFDAFSLTNDELSAIFRTKFDSFRELIDLGILATDPHPAGVQIFMYYWLKIFSDSAFWVRLPFVLISSASIILIAAIAREWFGNISSLLTAAAFASLEFPLMYGQIARPYSIGLFFCLLTAFGWTHFIQKDLNRKWAVLYVLAAAACAYTHYFSGLFAFMVGATGLLLIKRKQILTYLVINSFVLLLFFPHIRITLHQLKVGGLSGWLPKPELSFIGDHFLLLFNQSVFFIILISAILIFSLFTYRNSIANKFRWISLLWFVFPFTLGYVYSVFFETVLMHRVLLFSFPFLYFFLFSFFQREVKGSYQFIFPLSVLALGVLTTVFSNRFYGQRHFEDFNLLAHEVRSADNLYGADKINHTINLNSERYIQYYLDRMGHEVEFNHIQTINDSSLAALMETVKKSRTPYFLNGWACIYQPPAVSEIIKRKYPTIVRNVEVFNTEFTLYGRGIPEDFFELYKLESFDYMPTIDEASVSQLDSLHAYKSKLSYRIDSNQEFALTKELTGTEIIKHDLEKISISARMMFSSEPGGLWVISIERDGQSLKWFSAEVSEYVTPGNWGEVFLTSMMPEGLKDMDVVKVYFWNRDGSTCWVDNYLLLGSKAI